MGIIQKRREIEDDLILADFYYAELGANPQDI